MFYYTEYDSPLGKLTVASDGDNIVGLWLNGQRYFLDTLPEAPISIIIPCHRVVGTDLGLTGYAGGIDKKIQLLKLEGVDIQKFSILKSK